MIYDLVHTALHEAEDMNVFGLFSLLMFFSFFTVMLFWVFQLKKNHLEHMGDLPLDGGERQEKSNDQL